MTTFDDFKPRIRPSDFGMEGWHAGPHKTRDSDGRTTGTIWVSTAWHAELQPVFDPPVGICCVKANYMESNRIQERGWHRAALECARGQGRRLSVLEDIERDPVEAVVSAVPLFPKEHSAALDGIGYDVSFESVALSLRVRFWNPTNDALRSLERALFELVGQLLASTSPAEGDELLNKLRGYLRPE